ncbi:MAG: DinB family protein [FCB group bacterium]|nr:DinB family protein [FCB group bacterium]
MKWVERQFEFGLPASLFPNIIERLSGTPVRIEEKIQSIPAALLTKKIANTWSIQENVGHLLDLESLWEKRLNEILNGEKELCSADLGNESVYSKQYNDKSIKLILNDFREVRQKIVNRLMNLNEQQITLSAMHPRLQKPMRIIDLFSFVVEHDDHHLARITELKKILGVV